MDHTDAIDIFLTQYKIEPRYVLLNEEMHTIQKDMQRLQQKIALVYELRNIPIYEPIYLDAEKGNGYHHERVI